MYIRILRRVLPHDVTHNINLGIRNQNVRVGPNHPLMIIPVAAEGRDAARRNLVEVHAGGDEVGVIVKSEPVQFGVACLGAGRERVDDVVAVAGARRDNSERNALSGCTRAFRGTTASSQAVTKSFGISTCGGISPGQAFIVVEISKAAASNVVRLRVDIKRLRRGCARRGDLIVVHLHHNIPKHVCELRGALGVRDRRTDFEG
mmetsp:Transcript_3334/g.8630  ORF Transcript_3334/g.8630 Transcript_3334/m.8630 type:complete len:204 (-) Transcript_3334:442-1053(-)